MAVKDCLEAIKKAFKGKRQLSDEDARFILEELERRRGGRQAVLDLQDDSWLKAADELAKEIQEAAIIERRNHKLNVLAKSRLLRMAREADKKFGDPSAGIEAAMVGINRPILGGRHSVDARQGALFNQYLGGMVADLERGNLLTELNSGRLDLEIARALEKITKPEAKGSQSKSATEIAKIIHKHRRIAFDRQNRAGAWNKPLSGFITRQSHDLGKVRAAGFDEWRAFITPLLDETRTFGDRSDAGTFLEEAYKTVVTGETHKAMGGDTDLKLAFTGPGNLAKRVSQHRVLHFKDAEAWMTYNQRFGMKSLRESIVGELNRMADNTAIMEVFGTNPKAMFDEVLSTLRQEFRNDPKKFDRLKRGMLQKQMDVIDGSQRIPGNITMGRIGQWTRAFQSMSKLGAAAVSSITDVANKAATIRYLNGEGVLTPVAKSITTFFDGIPSAQRRETAELIGVGLDGMRGEIAARFSAEDTVTGSANGMLRWFFKLNLLTPWTDYNKRGLGLMVANHLAKNGSKSFDALPDQMKFIFGQYDFDARHWQVAREAIKEAPDGRSYLFPGEVRDLPNSVFEKAGLNPTRDKDFIETAIRSFYHDMEESGVPTPGARERAMLTQGFRPGTPEGEAMRFISQFKAFPLTVLTRVVGRAIYNNADGRADKLGLAMFIAQATILGYVAMVVKDLTKGKTPRPVLDTGTWIAAMLQGGALGIYGDFLLGETNRFGRSMLDTLAGPTLGTISDIDELRARIMAGDDVAASAFRLALNQTPFTNLFYTRLALDYLIINQLQEILNPGYLRRAERRVQKEQGQRYLVPPSKVIPRGGGNRIFEGVR
jgi:hypothetical protein